MPEHTIPESLIENIRSGRAALVVGAGTGVPSWKQLLSRMNEELRARGEVGDEVAAHDVDRLLHKASLVRAAGFLGRTLGEATCDRVVSEVWAAGVEIPPVVRALARLPFRQVWTTFPGDVLERAMAEELPEGWPLPRVLTWEKAHEIERRKRTLLKILGDFGSYVITPRSIRRMISRADGLGEHVRHFYSEGSLVFVGFRYGDPDLAALLDRVLGRFEPPQSNHYLIASGMGPVTVDELMSEHDIQVINLPGKGMDDRASEAVLEYLSDLADACAAAGIRLGQTRPDDSDLDGWLAVLDEDPFDDDAAGKIAAIEAKALEAEDWERLVEVLMARVEIEGSAPGRAALLRQVAHVFESRIGDLPRAFTATTAALREDPADPGTVDDAERLAEATGSWAELVGDLAQAAGEIDDRELAAATWTRLGRWYHKQLDHVDYAVASYREAIKLEPGQIGAYRGLAEAYRVSQRWAELAEVLEQEAELESDSGARLDLYLSLGDLHETQLASTARAVDAYQKASDIDPACEDALVALERLVRRQERWGMLARVLERRAELFDAAGEVQRAAAARRELATLRAEKLGDLEGAITKYEAATEADSGDAEALRALVDLYDKVGRTAEYLATLERLSHVAPDSERAGLLRRLAIESEDREAEGERAVRAYEGVLALESAAEDAFRGLARLHRAARRWDELLAVLERHAGVTRAPAVRADLWAAAAEVHETQLSDPHRAIEAHQNALAALAERRQSLAALARLYARIDAPARALEVLVQQAELEGERGADLWASAAEVAAGSLGDLEVAERHLEKALSLDSHHRGALVALARLHQEGGQWGKAVARLVDAAEASSDRREKVELLMEAAQLHDERLEQADRALALWLKVAELDPDNQEAGGRAAERLCAAGRWQEALPLVEMLARTAPQDDRLERARRECQLAEVAAALGLRAKAVRHYHAATEADPGSVDAALGWCGALFSLAGDPEDGGEDRWHEAERAHRDLLVRHQSGLADGQVALVWWRLAVAHRALGQAGKAEDALRRALEREPRHAPSLEALVELAEARGDFKTVVAGKRDLMEAADDASRVALLEQVGDLTREKLGDPDAALGAYLEAIQLRPGSHVLLHKTLEIYIESKEWRRAIDTLAALAETETEPRRRAKYHYTAAVIARDELDDADLAVEQFRQALEFDPSSQRAEAGLEALLEAKGDWKNLARFYRGMLKQLGEDAASEVLLPLWSKLGQVCLEHLGDAESAIAAFEVAVSLEPGSRERHEQLAELYLDAGDVRRPDAIEELQYLVQSDPDRVELYRALANLYRDEHDLDKAFCLAQALVFLRAAGPEDTRLFEEHRPENLLLSRRRLTEELWQKAILHRTEDRHVNAIFASLVGGMAATTAQPAAAFHLSPKDRVDLGSGGGAMARLVNYTATVLGVEPHPELYILPQAGDGLRVANTVERGKLMPALLVGAVHLERAAERDLAFDLGKRMSYLRADRYVSYAMTTLATLETAFTAALVAAGVGEVGEVSDETTDLARTLARSVPAQVLAQVAAVARKMPGRLPPSGAASAASHHNGRPRNGAISGWRTATDLTANRVGLILCNDLETAARRVAVEAGGVSALPAKDRLRDLLAYSVSESYFAVRRHLGLALEAGRSVS